MIIVIVYVSDTYNTCRQQNDDERTNIKLNYDKWFNKYKQYYSDLTWASRRLKPLVYQLFVQQLIQTGYEKVMLRIIGHIWVESTG